MRRLTLLCLMLAGCAATAEPVMAPDGSQGWYIECRRSMRECLSEAAQRCPAGYSLIDGGGRTTGALAQTNANGTTIVGTAWRGNMTVQCRPQAPIIPPTGCALANGAYVVTQAEREGTCGPLHEIIVNWTGDKWQVPPKCTGTVDVTPDRCKVTIAYKCPPDGGLVSYETVQVTSWNREGTGATSIMQQRVQFASGATCASTYDGTYTHR